MCVCSVCVRVCIPVFCGVHICFRPADSRFVCALTHVCVVYVDMSARACPQSCHSAQCLLCSPALFVPVASCL